MTRIQILTILFLLVSPSISERSTTGSTRRDKDRLKEKYRTQSSRNPCNVEERDAPIHCYCSPNGTPANATSADCWVFANDITGEFKFWGYFSHQPYIQEMKIHVRPNARLATIPTKAFLFIKDLKSFSVTYGNVEKIHSFAFGNLTLLTELRLSKNQIINLEEFAFAHLPNLTEIILDDNRIAELHVNVFVNVPNLQRLYVTQNNLSFIEEGAFKYLANLLELELQQNYLNVLTKETFTGLSGLKKLDLSQNKITLLGDLSFAELWDLQVSLIIFKLIIAIVAAFIEILRKNNTFLRFIDNIFVKSNPIKLFIIQVNSV